MANKADKLEEAAMSGDLNKLYEAIKEDAHILEKVDAIPFVDTPLHIAAAAGHVHFAIQIMRLKPSLALKLNQEGLSPIHVALHNNHHNLVRRLVDIDRNLIRVKEGREGLTPLHLVCQFDDDEEENITLLHEFLKTCPDCIGDVNVKDETALHLALKYKNLTTFQVLLGWLIRNVRKGAEHLERSVLNKADEDGNTILHISARMGNKQAVELLIKDTRMSKSYRNSENKTALEVAAGGAFPEIEKILSNANFIRVKGWIMSNQEKVKTLMSRGRNNISSEQRDAYMVVASLIISAVYQSALSPPGGLHQADGTNLNATSPSIGFHNLKNFTIPGKAGESILPVPVFLTMEGLNYIILVLTTVVIILFLMPGGLIGFVMAAPTVLLVFSYLLSTGSISPTRQLALMLLSVAFGILYLCFLVLTVFISQRRIKEKELIKDKKKVERVSTSTI